jgi:pilus assembly protein CpaB
MKWAVIGLVLIGVAAAVSAAALMASLAGGRAQAEPITKRAAGDMTILVASRPLGAVTVLPADAITEKVVSDDQVPRRAVLEPSQLIGKVLITAMVEGQPFTADCFALGGSGMNLAGKLPPGKRAVTISLTESGALEGLLYPGATVDVLASFSLNRDGSSLGQAVSTTLLHNVQVLAVDDRTVTDAAPEDEEEPSKARPARTVSRGGIRVTLLVDSRQAKALQLATGNGTISLAMRNPSDDDRGEEDPTLLNGGQLAQLAQLLEAPVNGADFREPRERVAIPAPAPPPPAPVVEPQPVVVPVVPAAPPPTPMWDVQVIRGTEVQVRSFEIEPRSSEVAE